jgi:hypothetical protein
MGLPNSYVKTLSFDAVFTLKMNGFFIVNFPECQQKK